MLKRFLLSVGAVFALIFALAAVKADQIKGLMAAPHVQPAESVTAAQARADTWQRSLASVASLSPLQGITVSAQQAGQIVGITVESGAAVKAGELLLQLDISVEQAQLDSAEANLDWTRLRHERNAELRRNNTVAQSDVDLSAAQLRQAEAEVARVRAVIEQKTVRAPFAGRVGIRAVNVGQFVSPGTALIPLHRLDSIHADFHVPQRFLQEVVVGGTVGLVLDAFPGRRFAGKVTAINPQVDPATRSVAVQARLENPGEVLRPGMFGRMVIDLPQQDRVVVVPATAVAAATYGNSVFVIASEKDKGGREHLVARQVMVRLGERRGDLVAIIDGLKGGETIATSGVFKLRNGVAVQVNNAVQPPAEADPRPANI